MKEASRQSYLQLNLELIKASKAAIPNGQQRELDLALAELLLRVAQEHVERSPLRESEVGDEPETHR